MTCPVAPRGRNEGKRLGPLHAELPGHSGSWTSFPKEPVAPGLEAAVPWLGMEANNGLHIGMWKQCGKRRGGAGRQEEEVFASQGRWLSLRRMALGVIQEWELLWSGQTEPCWKTHVRAVTVTHAEIRQLSL